MCEMHRRYPTTESAIPESDPSRKRRLVDAKDAQENKDRPRTKTYGHGGETDEHVVARRYPSEHEQEHAAHVALWPTVRPVGTERTTDESAAYEDHVDSPQAQERKPRILRRTVLETVRGRHVVC